MKYKKINKSAVSLMISYVLLISIVLALSVGVFTWLKLMADVSPQVDCKDDTSLVIMNYKCNPDLGVFDTQEEKFNTKNLKLDLKNNGRFNIDGVIVTVGTEDSSPIHYLAPDLKGGRVNGHYYFSTPLEPQEETSISFINQEYNEKILYPTTFETINKIEIQPFIIIEGDKFERIICKNAIKRIDVKDCTIIGEKQTTPINIPDPIAHWKLEDNQYLDETGYENNWITDSIDYDPLITSGKSGNALEFDGTNNHLKMTSDLNLFPNIDILELQDEITISAWIKTNSLEKQGIIKRGGLRWTDLYQQYALYLENRKAYLVFGDESDSDRIESTTTINENEWHWVTGVLQNNNIMKIYIDGQEENTGAKTLQGKANFQIQVLGALRAEDNTYSVSHPFQGTLDQVKIWNTALTQEQISEEYSKYN